MHGRSLRSLRSLVDKLPHLLSTIQHPECERTLPGASPFHCRAALTSTANHPGQNERIKATLSKNGRKYAQIDDAGQFGRCGRDTLRPFGSITYNKSPGRKNLLAISNAANSSPPAPYRRFGRFQTGKTTTCHHETQKEAPEPKKRRATNPSAHRTPDTQTLRGRPPTRVEPNCDASDQLSELRVQ